MTTRKTNKKQATNNKRKPQHDHAQLLFALLMGTALLTLCIGLANRMVQTQKRLETVQSKLQKISEEIVEAKARAFEFQDAALDLRRELDTARQSSHRAQRDAAIANEQVTQLRSELSSAEIPVVEMRSRLEARQSDLEVSEQEASQAKSKAIELGEQAIQLQSELEMGKAERDELRRQLNQAQVSSEVTTPVLKQRYRLYGIDLEARDYLIRTIVFEGGGETEMAKAALAHVILNRQRAGKWGAKIKEVVMHPWQFEPWMTRRGEIENLSSNDPRYEDTAEIVDSVLTGRAPDPTAGATYFLNPVVVRKRRGGSLPLWADGEGRPIGRHVFYSPHDVPGRSVLRRPDPAKSKSMVGG